MLRKSIVLAGVMAFALLGGCATVPKQAFNKAANADIRTVVVLDTPSSGEFMVQNFGHPGLGFGLIGGLIAGADMQSKTTAFTEKMKSAGFNPAAEFNAMLVEELRRLGYQVKVARALRPKPAILESYDNLDQDADAYLDSVMSWSGYFTASPVSNYIPAVRTMVRIVKRKGKEIAYQELISYGYEMPGGQAINIPADGRYAFRNFDDLTRDHQRALEGIRSGIPMLVRQVGRDLSN